MAVVATLIIVLLGVAIFSLSRMQSAPWTSSLSTPTLQSTSRNPLPPFEHSSASTRLTPQHFVGKWTLLTFWSYSCPPCLEELPGLNQFALTWQGPELQVLTVNVDADKSENLELAKKYLAESQITLTTFYDNRREIANAFNVNEYPRHFLVNPDSQVVWEAVGAFRWNEQSTKDQMLKLTEQPALESSQDPGE
jgi:thiol-disulfide isomerase/thioredoxin